MSQVIDAPATAQTAIAKRQYQPLAPIGSAGALKGLLESQKESLGQMLPKHVSPERLLKTLLVAANRNPDIFRCTQSSVIETINRAAELGLDLSGTLGEAYPVPFNNKVKTENGGETWVMQLQLIIGYRGMEKLAWQSGEVESIDAEVVYANDTFVFRKGTEVHVEWSPHLGEDRGDIVGAYACIKMKSGGKLARFLTKGDIEKIRNSSKSANSPAWKNWWTEMARKCALKRTLKDAPLSTEKMTKAMEFDAEDHMTDVLEAATAAGQARGVAALAAKLTKRPVSEGQTFEPAAEAMHAAEAEAAETQRQQAEAAIANAPRATQPPPADAEQEQRETDVSGADAEPPTADVSSYELFYEAMQGVAASSNVDPKVFEAAITQVGVDTAVKRPTSGGKQARKRVYAAAAAGSFDWAKGKVIG